MTTRPEKTSGRYDEASWGHVSVIAFYMRSLIVWICKCEGMMCMCVCVWGRGGSIYFSSTLFQLNCCNFVMLWRWDQMHAHTEIHMIVSALVCHPFLLFYTQSDNNGTSGCLNAACMYSYSCLVNSFMICLNQYFQTKSVYLPEGASSLLTFWNNAHLLLLFLVQSDTLKASKWCYIYSVVFSKCN